MELVLDGRGQQVIGAASGALGFGAFAAALATCCGVPWAVALFGVTGAVALARLAYFLPYTVIGAVLLLTVAFWLAYRPAPVCADGTCQTASRRPLRWAVWIAALLVAGLLIFAFVPLVRL